MAVGIFSSGLLGLINTVPVDVKTGEFHESTAVATQYAIEDGSVISDHILLQPDVIEVAFEVSNLDFNGSSAGVRAATIYQLLLRKMKARELMFVLTRHNLYTNMALIELPVEASAPYAGRLIGRARFQQINLPSVINLNREAKFATDGTEKIASDTIDGGVQAPSDVDSNQSILFRVNQYFAS